ncbi:MAG: VWA domain-containing protein [Holophagaceae bacterium]|nr:VWA domain-containing protein [Holophagaceae bacterium]
MRSSTRFALIPALVASAALPAFAQGAEAASDSGDKTLSPYFFVNSEDPSTEQLPLKSTSVKVEVAGVIADVRVTQVYKNQGQKPIEAVYVFPGSTRAAVHGMKMTIGTRVIQANIREKAAARQEYEQARQSGRTASLLEQQRPNVFQMNVANILPGDEIIVELSYTELLIPVEGTYEFVYPTVVGPRYAGAPGTSSSTGEKWVANPYTKAGEAPLSTFDMEVRLAAGMPIQKMVCGSHKTAIAYDGPSNADIKLDASESQGGNRDFILKYQLAGGQVQSGLLLHKGKEENYFLLMVQPPKRVAAVDMPAREYVFILDVSGSQAGFPLGISKTLMAEMISKLRPQDLFNVMVFEGTSAFWSPKGSRAGTPENLQQALAFVNSQNGGGGTELASALRKALALPRVSGISRSFVVSTDGYISADKQIFDLIRDNLGDANLFAFGIGSSVNRFLIEGMAHAGQGEAFVVTSQAQAPREAERFRAYVSSPALTNLKLVTSGFQTYDIEPPHLPDVLADRPVVCFGKWRGEPSGSLTLSGVGGHGPWKQQFNVAEATAGTGNAALRQLWARQRIQLLSDYNHFGETEERKREITSLGLTYNLLTAHTSFVAVDSEVRTKEGAPTSVTQPLPMPQGVPNSAVGSLAAMPVSRSSASMAALSPGVVKGASATVTVTAAAAHYEVSAICCAAMDFAEEEIIQPPAPRKSEKRAQRATEPPSFQIGKLSADREGVPLLRTAALVEQKMMELAKAGLLKDLPATFNLQLRVDASGAVTSVNFDRACGRAGQRLEARLLAWRFETWTVSGATVLNVPVHVNR